MTEKLYYQDSHLFEFSAKILTCREEKNGWSVTLDRTAFFPEGGGQLYDTGTIGTSHVTAVKEKEGEILHYVDLPLESGTVYECRLDREQRLRRMQNHSGEHTVSGITHQLFGYDNVGFHMGEDFMTLDFSGELTEEDVEKIERMANEAVRANLPIHTWFPDAEELAALEYRSKLELTHDVRIVEIPGIDVCACCAPHVSRTGEIGLIKILTFERHRGGMRLTVTCGMDALRNVRTMQRNVTEISNLLSAKREETASAVRRMLAEKEQMKERYTELGNELIRRMADSYAQTEENICVFDQILNETSLREFVNLLTAKTRGLVGAFSGSDETGYRYIIAGGGVNLRQAAKEINAAINGRGGGSPEMIMGTARSDEETIRNYIQNWKVKNESST